MSESSTGDMYKAIRFPDDKYWVVMGPWELNVVPNTTGYGKSFRPHVAKCGKENDAIMIAEALNYYRKAKEYENQIGMPNAMGTGPDS